MTGILGEGGLDWFGTNFTYIIVAAIFVVGLVVGLGDLKRISPVRIWAIGSVGFRESMRRRVLWVTPLAMLGIVAVTQLSHPLDEQDAIRQATKYCLFASGLVVVIAALILACTSLPKEIDNRVIYTIVTKPATRLEIVLGKAVGFACTAAAILLVMGVFSYAYLRVNASQLTSSIATRLHTLPPGDPGRETLQHYQDEGLLVAQTYARPAGGGWGERVGLNIYAKVPDASDPYRWIMGSGEQNVLVPYTLPANLFTHPETQLIFTLQIATRQRALNKMELDTERPDPGSTTRPTTRGVETHPGKPRVSVTLLGETGYTVGAPGDMIDVLPHPSEPTKPKDPAAFKSADAVILEPSPREGVGQAIIVVPPKLMQGKIQDLKPGPDGERRIYLMINGLTQATSFGFGPDAVGLSASLADSSGNPIPPIAIGPAKGADGKPLPAIFRGRILALNPSQQIRGAENPEHAPVGIYTFRGAKLGGSGADAVPFEFRTKVERSGAEATDADDVTKVDVTVYNLKTGRTADTIPITVDSDRPTFFRVPRAAVEGGDFDLRVRSRSDGHYVGLRVGAIAVVSSTESFLVNLFKSLLILWMLSVLVVIISIFCSTFVSWPIAVVLTLVILLGRWCVVRMGEPSSPQQMAADFFGTANADAVQARVFTDALGAMTKLLTVTAKVLPDLDQFRVTEDIERGVSIPMQSVIDPVMVLLTFGLPLTVLAYVLLRRKEVAP